MPPADLLPPRPQRAVPYLYSDAEIAALMARHRHAALPAAASHLSDADRPAGGDRACGSARRSRLDRADLDLTSGRADRPRRQVRQDPPGAAAPEHGRGAARLPRLRADRPSAPEHRRRCWSPRPGTRLIYCNVSATFRRAGRAAPASHRARRRADPALTICATASRSPPCSTGYRDGGDVAGPAAAAVDLPRARRPGQHLLVSVTPRRSCSPSPASGSNAHLAGRPADERARPDPAGVLHRPADPPAPRQPAHHRRLPRHAAAAARASPPQRTGTPPSTLDLADLDAPLIAAFLDHLEHDRGNSVRTRNARLAAIHSLFRYAALRHPEHAADHRPGAGDPAQTLRPGAGHLPHRTRDRRAARRPRPHHLDRPTRPRPAAARRPDRAARSPS